MIERHKPLTRRVSRADLSPYRPLRKLPSPSFVAPAIEPGPTHPSTESKQWLLSEWIPAPPAAVRDDERRKLAFRRGPPWERRSRALAATA